MSKVSIIIPSRNEKWLKRTIDDIYESATGDFEVLIGFNGLSDFPTPGLFNHSNMKHIVYEEQIGLKPMINKLASMANGKYLFKLDAHCRVGKGFDEILQQDMEDNWVVTPRFKIIKDDWSIQQRDGVEEFYDYFYLSCPFTDKRGLRFKAGGHWREETDKKLDILVDETPQMHGSGWFVNREYFLKNLQFPEADWDGHAQEPIWLGLRNWLKGGKLMVNKNTWYAHLHQSSNERGYPEDKRHTEQTYNSVATYWLNDKEPNLIHNFEWFISEKFPNMPTWPNDWRKQLIDWRINNYA